MRRLPVRIALPILAIAAMAIWHSARPSADDSTTSAQLDTILARFNIATPPSYRAFRRLEAGSPESGKHGWMDVWTEHRPGAAFTYSVVREGGSDYVRNKVLRGVLKGESELLANGKPLRAPIVARNYTIEDTGLTDTGLLRLLLRPARKSEGIVRGTALLEPESGAVSRIEGRLVKSPSFWVRDVDVTWKFTRIGDAILPTELTSSARVVFHGRQPFKMTYEYESVDGRVISQAARAELQERR